MTTEIRNNLFSFATSELSQDAFIAWCLNWQNFPGTPLYPLAGELLASMGVEDLPEGQGVKIHKQIKHIDILVALPGLNRCIIIEDKKFSGEHGEQISRYREEIKNLPAKQRAELGIDENAEIEVIFFKTGFLYDSDKEVDAKIIDGQIFLDILAKYKGHSDILDDYCDWLLGLDRWYKEHGQYDKRDEANGDWNIVQHHIAQHNFMRDMLRERFPESLWKKEYDLYKILVNANVGGSPRTTMDIYRKEYSNNPNDGCSYLSWRIDTNTDGLYIALKFYEWGFENSEERLKRHIDIYRKLRAAAQDFFERKGSNLQLGWNDVRGKYIQEKAKDRPIVIIKLNNILENWQNHKDIFKSLILDITDYFLLEIRKIEVQL